MLITKIIVHGVKFMVLGAMIYFNYKLGQTFFLYSASPGRIRGNMGGCFNWDYRTNGPGLAF